MDTMTHTVVRTAKQAVLSHPLLVVKISAYLAPKDIFLLAQVCQATRLITTQDAFWKAWGEEQSPKDLRRYEKALTTAALYGHLTKVTRLVTAGIDPTGGRAMELACAYEHVEVVDFLLSHERQRTSRARENERDRG